MRLWSIHPKYLDRQGLIALWREGLLARKVLQGRTKGYKKHPQLDRFKCSGFPVDYIERYLYHVLKEAERRKYKFKRTKISPKRRRIRLKVSKGQISYEISHLLKKLKRRSPAQYTKLKRIKKILANPIFIVVKGSVERFERIKA